MKVILTAVSQSIHSPVDPRFGRAAIFIIVDTDTLEWQAHVNSGLGAAGGAGTLAAQFIAAQKVAAVISGDFGPNAYNALHAAGVDMYLYGSCATVMDAVTLFKAGQLERVAAPAGQGQR